MTKQELEEMQIVLTNAIDDGVSRALQRAIAGAAQTLGPVLMQGAMKSMGPMLGAMLGSNGLGPAAMLASSNDACPHCEARPPAPGPHHDPSCALAIEAA